MAGVRRGLQNRCWSVLQAKVGSIPTLSATIRAYTGTGASHFIPHDPRPDSQTGNIYTTTEQILALF